MSAKGGTWHSAYGLTFENRASPVLSLPFTPCDPPEGGCADVGIDLGPVPARLEGAVTEHGLWSTAPGAFLLRDEGVGGFLAREGRGIVIDPAPGATGADLRMFVTGSVSAALLQQRGIVPLHASGVRMGDGIVLFAGASGAGKSSLLAEWLRRGHVSVSDDLAGIRILPEEHGGHPLVLPGYPVIKLWEDGLDRFGLSDRSSAATRVREGLPKHMLPVEAFDGTARPLRAIFFLPRENTDTVEVRRLSGSAAFRTLGRISYRKRMLQGLGASGGHFRTLSAILAHVPIHALTRGRNGFTTPAMADAVTRCLEESAARSEGARDRMEPVP